MQVSIVIPLHNEAAAIAPLLGELRASLEQISRTWEIICIDDQSQDATAAVIADASIEDPRIRLQKLPHRIGQVGALLTGFSMAQGIWTITMDGDGQNNPADLQVIVQALSSGADLVSGWRNKRQGSLMRRMISRVEWGVVGIRTGRFLRDYGCGFCGMTTSLARTATHSGEMRRFLKPTLAVLAENITEVPISDRPRINGSSHYSLRTIAAAAIDFVLYFDRDKVTRVRGGYHARIR